MRIQFSRPATALALAAAFSLTVTPAFADGWGRQRHHRGGIDGGDVLAGVLILGGIAAIASAAGKKSREQRDGEYRYPGDRYPETREPDWRNDDAANYRGSPERGDDYGARDRSGRGLSEAADGCVAEIEREGREVEDIEAVRRTGQGWSVEGRTGSGDSFVCSVGLDGQVRSAMVNGRPA